MKKEINKIYFDEYRDFEVVSGTGTHSFPMHMHQSLCIGVIIKGSALFVCEGQVSILNQGSKYIISPYSPHSLAPINGNVYSYVTICLKEHSFKIPNLSEYAALAKEFVEHSNSPVPKIQDMSEFVGLSKYHFIRKFKEKVGVTPYQFILNEKIKKARQGILSRQSLSDLALDLGFSDQSHLCNTFKKHMGISPLRYCSAHKSH